MSEPDPATPRPPRWQALLQRAADPLLLLNRRRQVLAVNRAWEELTGFRADAVRGARCRRRRDATPASLECLLSVLAPTVADVRGGQAFRVRRALPRPGAAPDLWDIHFFPLAGPKGRRLLLGKVVPVPRQAPWVLQPLPPGLVALRESAARAYGLDSLPDAEPAQRRLRAQVRLAAAVEVPALLVGERGTGKEWVARVIHRLSAAAERAFAAVDCERLPPAALAAALFGEPGLCFRAAVGVVYLREPQRLPRELQEKLCEALASPPPGGAAGRRPRVLAGCSTDPESEVRAGRLHAALHCTLSTVTIPLAPLRERPGELAWLVSRILGRHHDAGAGPSPEVAPEAWDRLAAHRWPGNVAELHAVLREATARSKRGRVEAAHLPWYLRAAVPPRDRSLPLKEVLALVEARLIELALRQAGGSRTRAAEILGVLRPVLVQKIKRLGVSGERGASAP